MTFDIVMPRLGFNDLITSNELYIAWGCNAIIVKTFKEKNASLINIIFK